MAIWTQSSGELLGSPPGLPWDKLTNLTPTLEVGEMAGTGAAKPMDNIPSDARDARWAIKQLQRETPRVESCRSEMRKAFKFFAGEQVSDSDRSIMEGEGRPIVTLNMMQRFIRIVDGIERRVPLNIYYVARDPSDTRAGLKGEMATKAKEWVWERCEAQFEICRAKHDRNVSGMGWVETNISRSDDPAGIIQHTRFSPFEALWPQSGREGLKGTRWRARERNMPVDIAMQKWPHVSSILLAASGGESPPKDYPVKADLVKYRMPWIMTEPTNRGADQPRNPEEVRVTDFQYVKSTEGSYFKDPILDQYKWLASPDYKSYAQRLYDTIHVLPANVEKVYKDVHWRLFLLNRSFLLDGPTKMPVDGFSLNCVTGDWDESRKVWYGMARMFFDPQLMIDKFASSAVEIVGAQTKGGLDVEVGAMSDSQIKDYKKHASVPGSIDTFKRNALTENRVRYKPTPQVPAGTTELLTFGMNAMETISGLTESLIAPNDSTGVGLRQRLSMGLLLLAGYFDSSARFERQLGRTTLQFIKLIADDRLIRVGGPYPAQGEIVQLVKEDFEDEYDTTVDDTENDPTLRRLYMDHVMQLAPVLIKTGNFVPELLDYAWLPIMFREKLKQAIQKNSQMQQQMRMMGLGTGTRGKSRTPEEVQAETMKTKGQAALSFAKAEHLHAQASDLSNKAVTGDLREILDAMLGIHKANLEERKHKMEYARNAAEMVGMFQGGASGANP